MNFKNQNSIMKLKGLYLYNIEILRRSKTRIKIEILK